MMAAQKKLWRNPRVACVSAFTLVFLCGAMVGALAYSIANHRTAAGPFWSDTGKALYMERVKKELALTPAQVEQMETILDDFAKYYRTVLSDGKSRILQILDEGQRRKFDQLLQESQR